MKQEFTEEKKVCISAEGLLHLIETQDVFNILSEENMEGLNELMKYELITVKDDKVYLTPLGKEAQIHGVKNVIATKSMQKITATIPTTTPFRIKKTNLWSLLFLFLALLFIVFQYIWQ